MLRFITSRKMHRMGNYKRNLTKAEKLYLHDAKIINAANKIMVKRNGVKRFFTKLNNWGY